MSASRTDRSWRARRAASTEPTGTASGSAPITTTVLGEQTPGVQHVVLAGGRLEDVLGQVERTFG
ncbi:MAG: hypothetical protein M3Y51_05310, partial [Actinomycetota bacterium]|nr:hypothetical protein [Actinomycetota bacterium]